MQARLGFAIAATLEADILIVDEVLAVGDLAFQQKCIARVERLIEQENRTVLIVGHNIRQLERICSWVLLFDHGQLIRDGNPSEVCGAFFNQTLKVISDSSDDNDSDGAIVPQHSSGTVKAYKIELGDIEGNPCASTGMHDAASVIIEFEALKWLDRPEFVVVFHTSDFLQLLSISSASSTFRPSFEIGRHRVICRIDDMMLRPSIYGLALGILDRFRHSLWASMNISRVIVDPGRYDITRLPEVGLIDAQAEWQVCEYLNIVDREAKV